MHEDVWVNRRELHSKMKTKLLLCMKSSVQHGSFDDPNLKCRVDALLILVGA